MYMHACCSDKIHTMSCIFACMPCRNFVDILKLYRDVGDVNDVNSATGAGASVMVVC